MPLTGSGKVIKDIFKDERFRGVQRRQQEGNGENGTDRSAIRKGEPQGAA